MGEWWRWALVSPDGVASMVGVLPLLIFPCTISSLLALAHPGGPGKRAIKWLWCGNNIVDVIFFQNLRHCICIVAFDICITQFS